MSQKAEKKARHERKISLDLEFLSGGRLNFDYYVEKLPPNKAMLIECEAVDERTLRLPKDLGGAEIKLNVSYPKPESGKAALVVAKRADGSVEYGVKSDKVFERKNALVFNAHDGNFHN